LKLETLLKAIGNNPMYHVTVTNERVMLRARAPSESEAASVDSGSSSNRDVVVLFSVESSGELKVLEAYVETPSGRRPISLDEIEWWLNILESMA
jgi:hypothetical protein